MSKREILYSVAETPVGQLIKACDADKESSYICPGCKQPFIFRKGSQNRPHFAHKVLTPNCTPETALHHSFKTLLHSKIQDHLDRGAPLKIQWTCSNCCDTHAGNLLKKAVRVELEYSMGACRPDIALLDKDGGVVAVVEVVVTHAPERAALEHYKQNQVTVLSYILKSDSDVARLDREVLEPDGVDLCTNPKCSECGNRKEKRHLCIAATRCWKCHSQMKVAFLQSSSGYTLEENLSSLDVEIAKHHGCQIQPRYSAFAKERYMANVCPVCRVIWGRFYLPPIDPEKAERVGAGYHCRHC